MSTSLVRRVSAANQIGIAPELPSTGPVHYLKLLQLWQWSPVFTPMALASVCRLEGFTGVTVKALDGINWMQTIEPSEYALGSYQEVSDQADYFHSQGLYYFVWTNPLQPQWEKQADMTGMLCEDTHADGVMLDIEPYAQFWGPYAQVGLASQFMQRIRSHTDGWVALQPDPRPMALQALRISEWVPWADAFLGQHYWSDFNTDPNSELQHAQALGSVLGMPSLPTLPGNAPGAFPNDLIRTFPGFCVWRYGTTPQARLSELGGLSVTGLQSSKFARR